jgi:hypothetical protein
MIVSKPKEDRYDRSRTTGIPSMERLETGQKQSALPAGLTASLTPDQLTLLIAILQSLK